MSMRKPIIGLEEEIRVFLPNGKFIRRKAKIDTGARTTAIDISVATKLGLEHVYLSFHRLRPRWKLTTQNFQHCRRRLKRAVTPRLKKKIPGLDDVRIIPATNGITMRPYVKIHFHLRGKHIRTIASIVDRKILLYPILIGKKDLAGFLIDPTKNVYKEA